MFTGNHEDLADPPHPPLRGTFSPKEKEGGLLRQSALFHTRTVHHTFAGVEDDDIAG